MTEPNASPRPSFLRRLVSTLKGFLLWRYERGSWQYDVMVALILVFVLATPARYFHDQPVWGTPLSGDLWQVGKDAEGVHYRVSAQLLASYHEDPRRAAEEVFLLNLGHPVTITRIEPFGASAGEVAWYDVWVRE